jgi:hypothetical protein
MTSHGPLQDIRDLRANSNLHDEPPFQSGISRSEPFIQYATVSSSIPGVPCSA